MNRKKKLQSLFNKRRKRARAKLDGRPKQRYVSKADRVKAEAGANEDGDDKSAQGQASHL